MGNTRKEARAGNSETKTLHGIVSPAGWDDEGRVVSVCIVTDRGTPWHVLPGGVGEQVKVHLKRYVTATGRVERRGGVPFMRVEKVEAVPHPDGAPESD
jgi:hypothetical protein